MPCWSSRSSSSWSVSYKADACRRPRRADPRAFRTSPRIPDFLQLRHFSDMRDESNDLAVDGVRDVRREAVSPHPVRTGHHALEELLLPVQRRADVRLVEREELRPQQILDRRAHQTVGVDTEPALVRTVGK